VAPFTWTVGGIYIGAICAVGLLVWLFEESEWNAGWRKLGMDLFEVVFDAASCVFFVNRLTYKTFAARIMIWFM
jgi:hypothetical protein